MFRKIQQAFEGQQFLPRAVSPHAVLDDPQKRALYDTYGDVNPENTRQV